MWITGEPVSSRAVSRSHAEPLSSATIRNVMADLEDAGFLYQPHTSAGRVPTASAYRFFAQQVAVQATLSDDDKKWIRSELEAGTTVEEVTERAGHVLAAVVAAAWGSSSCLRLRAAFWSTSGFSVICRMGAWSSY